jgi:hypothetical protein
MNGGEQRDVHDREKQVMNDGEQRDVHDGEERDMNGPGGTGRERRGERT